MLYLGLGVAELARQRLAIDDRGHLLASAVMAEFWEYSAEWLAGMVRCELTWLPAKTELRHMEREARRIVFNKLTGKITQAVTQLASAPKRKRPRYPIQR